jgi:hypothetical protein
MHEELKLNKYRSALDCPRLSKLLVAWVLFVGKEQYLKSGYLVYYISESEGLASGAD